MNIIITSSFFLVILQSCYSVSHDEKLLNLLINKYSAQQKKENNLTIFGTGSSMPDKINSIKLEYITERCVNIQSARKLMISCTQQLLSQVNSNEAIRPYLVKFPFDINNIEFAISFSDSYGKRVQQPNIAYAFVLNGKIFYTTYDHQNHKFVDEDFSEPYEEALKIVQGK